MRGTDLVLVNNPLLLPDASIIEEYYEPMADATIITPMEYMNAVVGLCVVRTLKQDCCIPMIRDFY